MPRLQWITALACVGMTAGFVWWNWQAFASAQALLLVLPMVVPTLFVFRRSVKALVVAGAMALPYLCIAIVEIIAANAASLPPIVAVTFGVVFMALLTPVTRNAKRAALVAHRQASE
ncbi:MAG: hypothetical protein AB8G17_12570 [Gammaproteobacteria bacterium]